MSTAVALTFLAGSTLVSYMASGLGREGGTGSVISLGVLLTMVSGLQGGRGAHSGPACRGQRSRGRYTEWGH